MSSPFFSIVIPCYNIAPFVTVCLESILSQTFEAWECICVDDGSSDDTGRIIDVYSKKDARIISWHKENGGVSSARNLGKSRAKGTWILFVDGDDTIAANTLEILHRIANSDLDLDVIKYGSTVVLEHGKIAENCVEDGELAIFDMNDAGSAVSAYNACGGDIVAWNACVRKDLAMGIHFKAFPNGEDILYGYEVICSATRMAVVGVKPYHYLRREGSALQTISLRHLESSARVVGECIGVVERWRYFPSVKRKFFRAMRATLMCYVYGSSNKLSTKERRSARRIVREIAHQLYLHPGMVNAYMRFFYWVALRTNLTLLIFLYWPMVVRSVLMKVIWVRSIWEKIR